MKKAILTLMCMAAMMMAGTSLKAQEITIVLNPGWTWISCPSTDTLDFTTAFGSFTPAIGDIIKSKWGSATYTSDYQWRGSISQLYPGYGYHYKSTRTMPVLLTFTIVHNPEVNTLAATNITATTATVGGNVFYDGNTTIIQCGVCWSAEPNTTINDNIVIAEGAVIGEFTVELDSLIPNTTYYIRAFAINNIGLAYGEEKSFTTLSEIPEGAINGLFSVSATKQVYFSKGNLQYRASSRTWRFAEHQYDFVGGINNGGFNPDYQQYGNVFEDGIQSQNNLISYSYSGWIDCFGWGTSGYHNLNDQYNLNYQPWSSSTSDVNYNYNYYGYGPSTNMSAPNLTGNSANYDWGVYNPIINGGNTINQWRTPTLSEWNYVFKTRYTSSGVRFAKAKVNNVNGVILLPDNWNNNIYSFSNPNNESSNYDSNILTDSQWIVLEQAGAVFFPAAGARSGTSLSNSMGTSGIYWSVTYKDNSSANILSIGNNYLSTGQYFSDRFLGASVRLVHDAE